MKPQPNPEFHHPARSIHTIRPKLSAHNGQPESSTLNPEVFPLNPPLKPCDGCGPLGAAVRGMRKLSGCFQFRGGQRPKTRVESTQGCIFCNGPCSAAGKLDRSSITWQQPWREHRALHAVLVVILPFVFSDSGTLAHERVYSVPSAFAMDRACILVQVFHQTCVVGTRVF